MSENISTPVEPYGEDPDEYALRSAAAEGVLEQIKSEPYTTPDSEADPETTELDESLVDAIIGTRNEPTLRTGQRIQRADGKIYTIETIDYNGRGVIVHQESDPGQGATLSFNELAAEIVKIAFI